MPGLKTTEISPSGAIGAHILITHAHLISSLLLTYGAGDEIIESFVGSVTLIFSMKTIT